MQNQEKIIDMFNEIAPTYDKANKILSFGIDASWRSTACDLVLENFDSSLHITDVACGTGDMVLAWINSAKKANLTIKKITAIDPSVEMLKVAKAKIKGCEFIESMANNLKLESNTQDILSISYGIRNVVARKQSCLKNWRIFGSFRIYQKAKRWPNSKNSRFLSPKNPTYNWWNNQQKQRSL